MSVSQSFMCKSAEGWGPLSTVYFDFTPCFTALPIGVVSLFGIVVGCFTVWRLHAKYNKFPISKDVSYYAKLVLVSLIGCTTTLQCIIYSTRHSFDLEDIRSVSTILQIQSIFVALSIHHLEHERLRVPSGTLLFYWLFFVIVSIIKTWSLYLRKENESHYGLGLMFTSLVLSLVVFVLETFVAKTQSPYQLLDREKEYPTEARSIFSRLWFTWLTPMIKHGYRTYITEEDLWNLPKQNSAHENGLLFARNWAKEEKRPSPSVWRALFNSFGGTYLAFVTLKLTSDILSYSQPQLLRLLIAFVKSYQTDEPQPPFKGFIIALCMFAVSLTQSVCNNQFMNSIFELSLRVNAGLISFIYKKSLKLSNSARATVNTGDIVNYMVVDTQRISELSRQGFQFWSAPFQISLCLFSLYNLLGWVGFTGFAVMLLMVPINSMIARRQKSLRKTQMKNKDERIRTTTEILTNIKSIKLYSWTLAFAKKLDAIRHKELTNLRRIGATQAASRFFWNSTPFFVAFATFTLFVLVKDEPLSVDLVFPALTLFNLLTQPLNQLPNVISSYVESTVAIGRLKGFFSSSELQDTAVKRLPAVKKYGQKTVQVSEATFTWGDENDNEVLSEIDYTARKGQLNCIVGRVGSGKSSMLHGILGDLYKLRGEVTVCGNVAFVAQNAWIMNATVRDNVLFGNRFNAKLYEKTIAACALTEDLSILPDGDLTEVGEKGISLSGGQKARVQLARAVYSNADIYLLDDVLSAVDQHVGRHIINEVLGAKGILRNKTRILATNSIPILREADHISLIKDGQIIEQGYFQEVLHQNGEIALLINSLAGDSKTDKNTPTHSSLISTSTEKINSDIDSDNGYNDDHNNSSETENESDAFPENLEDKDEMIDDSQSSSDHSLINVSPRASSSKFGKINKTADEEMALMPRENKRTAKTKEISHQGRVKWNVYTAYAKACNFKGIILWGCAVVSVQALNVSASVWLKKWSESNERAGGNANVAGNVSVYFLLGLSASLMIAIQTIFMWIFCAIQASRKLHGDMAHAIFRSPMSFFETTPVGRILNRFAGDMFRVDEAIGRSFSEFSTQLTRATFTMSVIVFTVPVFILILLPLIAVYIFIQQYYLRTNRELKRLESVSRSPIYAHFSETLAGLPTIRAFARQRTWSATNELRIDANLRAALPATHATRWLSIRLEAICALVVFCTASLCAWGVVLRGGSGSGSGGPTPGMVGLAMSYALQMTMMLNWLVRLSVEVETNVLAVERVLDYADTLPREAADVSEPRPRASWPETGEVAFDGVSMRYREGLKLVLRGVSVVIRGGEKIGIVGRTGAGKSSLGLVLFRIVEAAEGAVCIDGVDTAEVGLQDLRCKLGIIPQDAALFEGTVRYNLDPFGKKSDEELWTALENARLASHVRTMNNGLNAAIHSDGSNLSHGQRQLVSLARAMLTDAAILVLDEATAAVDVQTDALVQQTLRSDLFSDRTIITIAHRINTVMDCDRVLVLGHGEVRELGAPWDLVRKGGLFCELAREAGVVAAVK